MPKQPIMIMAAMEDAELDTLKKEVNLLKEVDEKVCKFYEAELNGYQIILCCSKIGCIQAAAATMLGIMKYHPIAIINEGLAGAMGRNIHKNDLVVGTEIINIHSVKTPNRKENEGVDANSWDLVTFIRGEEDKLKVEKADKVLVECTKNIEKEYTKGHVFYGRIGSGDIWNNEIDRILHLNETYKTLCEEMEGIAICQIANQFHVPVLDIRVISDNAILEEEYDTSVGKELQYFVIKLIKEYIANKK